MIFDGDEFFPDFGAVGVEFGVFDAEFAHLAGGEVFAVDLDGEEEVFEEGCALGVDGGWIGEGLAGEEGGEFAKDPGVADGASCDPDAVEVALLVHAEGVIGGEDVAGAEEGGDGRALGVGRWALGVVGNVQRQTSNVQR